MSKMRPTVLPASMLSLVGLTVILLAWYHGIFSPSPETDGRPVLVFTTVDSRAPTVPEDPTSPISFVALTTIHNQLYAKHHGGRFIYNVLNTSYPGQELGEPRPKEVAWRKKKKDAYCRHPKHGWRAATFCKSLVAWHMMEHSNIDYLVFIANLSVWRHLDLLSDARPFGILSNMPFDPQPNTGYWFVKRGRELADQVRGLPRMAGADFLLHWWNQDWADVGWGSMEEQAVIRRMLGWNSYGMEESQPDFIDIKPVVSLRDRTIPLMEEWQFREHAEDQMILHANHYTPDRFGVLSGPWDWDFSLDDRVALQAVLDEVEIRYIDANDYADEAGGVPETDLFA